MAWHYHKRIKAIPEIGLRFSKNNIGIRISVGTDPGRDSGRAQPGNGSRLLPPGYFDNPANSGDNIFSADVEEITSQDMQGIRQAILMADKQREELKSDLLRTRASLHSSRWRLRLSYLLLYGLIHKRTAQQIKTDIQKKQEVIRQLEQQITACCVNLDIAFDPGIGEQYNKVIEGFRKLSSSAKIWDVTSEHYQDRVSTRSSASAVVSKREVRFGIQSIPGIRCATDILWMKNANGADLYIYPGFILMYAGKERFALAGFHEIGFLYGAVRFIEDGTVPPDSTVVDRTWAKVNKNGTPDKRFKDNYQIPVVQYGSLELHTDTGMHEQYMFSNYPSTVEFGKAFGEFRHMISKLQYTAY